MALREGGVTVAICTYNGKLKLQPTIKHILSQQVSPEVNWELLVINNASTDGTVEFIYQCWPPEHLCRLRIVDEEKLGAIYARQKAIQEARYSYLSYVDDDNWISSNWIEEVFNIFEKHPQVALISCSSNGYFEAEPPTYLEGLQGWLALGSQSEYEGVITNKLAAYWTAGLSIRLETYEPILEAQLSFCLVGRQGQQITGGEDHELCLMIALLGWGTYFSREIWFTHYIPASRMQVSYLKRLIQSGSRSRAVLDIYKNEIMGISNKLVTITIAKFIIRWLISFTKYILKFYGGRITDPLHPNIIGYLQCTGHLQGCFLNFKGFNHALRNAEVLKEIRESRIKEM
jgi:glycosyltransferase involved in cell wall biosynthesis